jgi:glycosyltransferase involved in cell wall biosynthesis
MSPAPKNIVVLLSDAFGGFGGIAKFNRDLLNAICAHPASDRVLAIPRVILQPVGLLHPKLDYVIAAANRKTRFLTQLIKKVWAFQPAGPTDLIVCAHINLLPAAFLARAIGALHRRDGRSSPPIVLMIHGIDAWQRTAKPLVNYFAKKVNAFVAVSDVTRGRFVAWTGIPSEKGFVLPNCVELSSYAPGRKNEDLLRRYQLQDRKVLLTFGRLHPDERYKGIDEVIEALGALQQQVPNLAFLVVGDGDDRPRLEQKVARLGLKEAVIFAGRVSEKEKADHYRLADVYVMPGYGEGFGIVYLEAMACGIPVIASKVDGSREAVREGALGKLVNPANPEELKAAILESLSNVPAPGQRQAPAGLEYFSHQNFELRCHRILEKIWGKN